MRDKGEWEPDLWSGIGSWPPHVIVRAQCGKCGHTADVPDHHIQRLPPSLRAVDLVNRLSCSFCPQGRGTGRIAIYLRRKPRN